MKPKLLIADDEPNILMLTSAMFEEEGYDVIKAINGSEALEKIQTENPDLVILDILMPDIDGFEVCRRVRNFPENNDIPVILLSALGDDYNKITGFECGSDDYVTKPFNVWEFKTRIKSHLIRFKGKEYLEEIDKLEEEKKKSENEDEIFKIIQIKTGTKEFDEFIGGGIPSGANILAIGSIGKGKSTFCRKFLAEGLKNNERCMFICIDDPLQIIRLKMEEELKSPLREYENMDLIRFVDAYSWSTGAVPRDEKFVVQGVLELNQFSSVIADAGAELCHTVQNKLGGRRIIDSISSLFVNFELPSVQRFLNQIARTSIAFGGVTTIFVLEEGSIDNQILKNIKYLMDGVIEFNEKDGKKLIRVSSMKWMKMKNDWVEYKV